MQETISITNDHSETGEPATTDSSTSSTSKWLSINNLQVQLGKEANASLENIDKENVGLVMVWGQTKTGKSFLMNILMDKPDFFEMRGIAEASCTISAHL